MGCSSGKINESRRCQIDTRVDFLDCILRKHNLNYNINLETDYTIIKEAGSDFVLKKVNICYLTDKTGSLICDLKRNMIDEIHSNCQEDLIFLNSHYSLKYRSMSMSFNDLKEMKISFFSDSPTITDYLNIYHEISSDSRLMSIRSIENLFPFELDRNIMICLAFINPAKSIYRYEEKILMKISASKSIGNNMHLIIVNTGKRHYKNYPMLLDETKDIYTGRYFIIDYNKSLVNQNGIIIFYNGKNPLSRYQSENKMEKMKSPTSLNYDESQKLKSDFNKINCMFSELIKSEKSNIEGDILISYSNTITYISPLYNKYKFTSSDINIFNASDSDILNFTNESYKFNVVINKIDIVNHRNYEKGVYSIIKLSLDKYIDDNNLIADIKIEQRHCGQYLDHTLQSFQNYETRFAIFITNLQTKELNKISLSKIRLNVEKFIISEFEVFIDDIIFGPFIGDKFPLIELESHCVQKSDRINDFKSQKLLLFTSNKAEDIILEKVLRKLQKLCSNRIIISIFIHYVNNYDSSSTLNFVNEEYKTTNIYQINYEKNPIIDLCFYFNKLQNYFIYLIGNDDMVVYAGDLKGIENTFEKFKINVSTKEFISPISENILSKIDSLTHNIYNQIVNSYGGTYDSLQQNQESNKSREFPLNWPYCEVSYSKVFMKLQEKVFFQPHYKIKIKDSDRKRFVKDVLNKLSISSDDMIFECEFIGVKSINVSLFCEKCKAYLLMYKGFYFCSLAGISYCLYCSEVSPMSNTVNSTLIPSNIIYIRINKSCKFIEKSNKQHLTMTLNGLILERFEKGKLSVNLSEIIPDHILNCSLFICFLCSESLKTEKHVYLELLTLYSLKSTSMHNSSNIKDLDFDYLIACEKCFKLIMNNYDKLSYLENGIFLPGSMCIDKLESISFKLKRLAISISKLVFKRLTI